MTVVQGQIYGALARVMAEVGVVGKAKKNAQQGYQFRGIDDVVAHVQHVMAAQGVVVVPRVVGREREMVSTKSGGTMASVRLVVDHVFYAQDGSSVTCTTLGEAMDSGDKASNKAMSAALKYALTQTLLIPTYETDRDTEEAAPVMAAAPAVPVAAKQEAAKAALIQAREAAARPVAASGAVFPNYGRAKGKPIAGADLKDLEFYAAAARKSLADPSKSRWHDKERALLELIDAEIHGGRTQPPPSDSNEPPPHGDDDAPF